nr:MAG TPA: hypothetical protein [Caudoviricetes sp.]
MESGLFYQTNDREQLLKILFYYFIYLLELLLL